MRITRKTVVDAINMQSHLFPICNLIRIGDELHIHLKNCQYKEFHFKANFQPSVTTYYNNWKYLSEHPEIEIIQVIDNKILENGGLRKEYLN